MASNRHIRPVAYAIAERMTATEHLQRQGLVLEPYSPDQADVDNDVGWLVELSASNANTERFHSVHLSEMQLGRAYEIALELTS